MGSIRVSSGTMGAFYRHCSGFWSSLGVWGLELRGSSSDRSKRDFLTLCLLGFITLNPEP